MVELLAGIALIGIIIALISSIIYQTTAYHSKAEDSVGLRQQANLLVSSLRSSFHKGDNSLCINQNGQLSIAGVSFNPRGNIAIQDIELHYGEQTLESEQENCMSIDGTSDSMDIVFSLSDQDGQQFSINTVLDNPGSYVIDAHEKNEGNEIYQDWNEFTDKITFPPIDSFEHVDGYQHDNSCQYETNLKVTGDALNFCSKSADIRGNVWYPDSLTTWENTHIVVHHNLYSDSTTNMWSKSSISISGEARLTGRSTLGGQSQMSVRNLYAQSDLTIQESSKLSTSGSLRVDGTLKMTGQSSKLHVKGHGFFAGAVHFQEGAEIIIDGNAEFLGEISPEWGHGSLCVKGESEFSQKKPEWLKLQKDC